jgi:hypothetical protein
MDFPITTTEKQGNGGKTSIFYVQAFVCSDTFRETWFIQYQKERQNGKIGKG